MNKEDEKKILSVEDLLYLKTDKHAKENGIMPDVDTSKYVLRQKPKTETVRKFAPIVNITEEQRRQFSQGGSDAKNRDSVLAEQARQAIKVAEMHAEEEAVEHAKVAAEKTSKEAGDAKNLAREIKAGNFDFSFGALIEGAENIKETV